MPLSTYILTQGGRRLMHKMTQFFMRVEKKLDEITPPPANDKHVDVILDSTRCPITGRQMTNPVQASDGITYEQTDLELWIKTTTPPISPISLAIFTTQPKPNRRIKDLIEVSPIESTAPTPEIIMRIRLRASLQWIVKYKYAIDKEEDFTAVFNTFIHTHPIPQNTTALPWPRKLDAPLCADLARRCYKLDSIIESICCPISGLVMNNPVHMSDGVTYDDANIANWMAAHDDKSPFSKQRVHESGPCDQNILSLIQNVQADQETPYTPTLLRVRLRASLNWIVRSKFPFLDPSTFETAYNDFSHRSFPEDPWPLSVYPETCVELTWIHCGHLRAMVYAEFAKAAGDAPHASEYTKQLASRHFVSSMRKHPLESKTNQLITALRSAYSIHRTSDETPPPFDVTGISDKWTVFWGDPHPQQPSIYVHDGSVYPPPQNRGQHDWSRPHEGGYEDYGTAGPQHYAWGWPNNS
jgi:hypothetical protein